MENVLILKLKCNGCSIWHNKKANQVYVEWEAKLQPHCKANHKQSSGAMESAMFKISVEKNKLRYVSYMGTHLLMRK